MKPREETQSALRRFMDGFCWLRITALLVDLLLPMLVCGVPALLLGWLLAHLGAPGWWLGLICVALGWTGILGYVLVRDAIPGGSPGKRLMGLTVVVAGRKNCTWRTSLLRNLTLLVPIFNLIEIVLVLRQSGGEDEKRLSGLRRRLGDRLASTRVVDASAL